MRIENTVLAEPALRLFINYHVILTGSNNVGVGGASVSYFPAPQIAQTGQVNQTEIDQDQEVSAPSTWVSRMNAFSRELLCVESYMVPDVWDEGWNDYHYGCGYTEPRYTLDYDSKKANLDEIFRFITKQRRKIKCFKRILCILIAFLVKMSYTQIL